jgi:O-antigen/teichoic acid export membrane protein
MLLSPALLAFGVRVVGAGLAFLLQIIAARFLGAEGYGIYSIAWLTLTILGHATLLGMGQTICRFVPEALAQGNTAKAGAFVHFGLKVVLLASGTLTLLGLLLLALIPFPPYSLALMVALLAVPLFALHDYIEGLCRSVHHTTMAIAPIYIVRPLFILGFFWLMQPNTPPLALAYGIAALGLVLVGHALWTWRIFAHLFPKTSPSPADTRLWWRTNLPVAWSDAVQSASGYLDTLVLSLVASPSTVGAYFAATRLVQIVLFAHYAGASSNVQKLPAFFAASCATSSSDSPPNLQRAKKLFAKTTRTMVALALLTAAALWVALPWLTPLFGKDLVIKPAVVGVLLLGILIHASFGMSEEALNVLGQERLAAKIMTFSVTLTLGLTTAGVLHAGDFGAACGMSLGFVLRGALARLVLRRALRL